MKLSRRSALMGMTALAIAAPAASALAAPSSSLIDGYWNASGSADNVDHSAWGSFLSSYVRPGSDGVNRVAYGSVSDADKQALKGYIAMLESSDPTSLTRDAQMAYWINLYNAKTVDLVIDAYPVSSIKKIKGGLFNTGPWDEKVMNVAGRPLSLNDVEHGILRPVWNNDPRIHYAVNCASIGCPNLGTQPFTSANLASMLDQSARDFINHPRGADVSSGRLVISSIFEWYQSDFGGNDAGVIAHMKQYATGSLAAGLANVSSVYDDRYDWNLNAI